MILFWRKPLKVVYAVLAVLVLSAGVCRSESEIWRTAVPSSSFILRAVWGHSPQGVFAVGDAGMILHYDGSAWRTMASGTDRDLAAVWGSDPSHVFAAGRDGTLLFYDGSRWRGQDGGTGEDLHAVWGGGVPLVFAAGSSGVIRRFDGAAWRPMAGGVDATIYGLWGNSAANVIAVGGGGLILNYDGSAWRPMKSPTGMVLRAVWGASRSDVFAAGSGLLLRYNGRDWRDVSDGLRFITCLWGTSGTDVYSGGAASDGEGGFVRRFDGSGWRDENIDAEAPIHGLWGDGRGNVFAVGGSRGMGGVIYRFDGRSWQEAWRQPEESLNHGLRGLWTGPDGHAVAVGDGGRVIRYDGASWSALDSGAPADYRGVWGADGRLFVVGENGVVRHFDGSRWEDLSHDGLNHRLNALWGYPDPDDPGTVRLVAVGDKGTILFYRGGAWEAAASGTTADLKDVFGTSGSDITAIGTAGTILHFDGSRWQAMESPTAGNLWGVWGAGPTDLFVVGDSNTILHFDGWLWRKMDDDPERSDAFKCVWGRSGRDVYAAGDDGTLQHYDGAGWRRMAGGTEASIRKIGGTPNGVLFAVDSDGGVIRAEALTLSLPSAVDEGAGPQAVQGVAAIPSPRPEDLRVYLVSGSPSDVGVPATVTIPAGQVSAGFDAAVLDNAMADGTRSVRVMAEAAGLAPGVTAMDVTDDETASLFLDIPGEVFEGVDLAGRGLVRMSVPAVRDVTVFLASDNPAAVRVPTSVVIPAGADRAVFDIRITDDTVIDEVERAGMTARVTGWTGGSAAMDVQDDDRYGLTLTLAPVAREGEGPLPGAGKVAVPVPFLADVVVTLTSDDTGEAVVPGTVTLPAGETAAVFDIFPMRDDLLDDAQPVLITATSPGFRGDEETITVLDGDAFWSFARRGSDVLRAVWGTAGGNAYAVGTYGSVLHHDGAAWRHMDTPVSGTLYDVWGASENDIFAVGDDADKGGIVLHFDGTAWQKMIEGGFESINGVWGTSGGNVYAVGGTSAAGGMILHYDGREWRQVMRHEQVLERVWGVSEKDVFAVGAKGTILHYDGAAWRVMESGTGERIHGIWGTSGSHVYAAGNGGVILHYDGAGWRPMESGVTDHLYGLWGCSETNIYAVGRKGLVLRYDGTGWQPMESGSGESLWGVWGACPENEGASSLFAVGNQGLILRFDGADWQPSKPVDVDLNDVWGGRIESESGAHAFAVGNLGTILRHDGTDWSLVETGFHPDLNGVWGYAADRMVAVGDVGTILQYDGHRWRRSPSGTYANLNDVSGCLTDEGLKLVAVGDDGTILTFDGAHWLAMDSGTTEDLFGVWITPFPKEEGGDGTAWEGFAVGWDGLILHWDGRTWQPMESGTPRILYGIWGASPSDLYAVGHLGTLLHYDGTAWRSIDVGSRLTLRGVWGRSERDVFVVGASGAVFHFDGVQWIRMEAPTGSYEKVWGAGRSVFVVGRYNFIIHYVDAGIRLPEQAAEEDGVLVGRGEVFLESASAADRTVTLRSHDPDEIAVPPVVTIPAGALSAVFDLTVLDDVLLDGTRRVAVTAATPGSSIGTAFVSVTDNEAAALTLSLPDTVTEGEKPAAGSCRIDVDRPVEKDVAVPLTSGDPAKLRVPAAVTIPFGETGAAFDLTVVDNRIFDGDRAVEIAAHVPGWTGDRRPVTVLDNEVTVLTLTVPETISEGAGLLAGGGSVAIPGIWPQDLTVALASDPPGHLILPAAVTLPAGRMQIDFDIAAADDAVINGDRAVTVTAEADAWTAASRAITVVDNDPGTLRFAADRFMAWETSGAAAVSVIREESTSGRIMVDVETLDGSATAGADYSRVAVTLVFADGESQKTFEIPVSADGWTEGVESIRLILDNPGHGAALGTPDTAEVMLVEAVSWQDDAGYQTESHLKGLWGFDGRNIFAVGWRGTILRYDGGAWHDMSLDTGETLLLEAVWGSRATDVFAVGGDGLILHYDGDKTFTVQESGTESDLYGVWGTSPRRVFAVGTGVILGYDGAEWREMTVSDGPVPDLKGIWGAGENDVFAVGYDGVILRFDGAAWRRMESGTTAHLYGVWGSGATDVFAVGAFGTILHYDGAGWRAMENGANRPVLFLDGVWGSSADDVFAVGYDGVILHYDGSRWQTMDAPGGGNALGAVWGPPGAGAGLDVFAVGEAGRMLHYAPLPAP